MLNATAPLPIINNLYEEAQRIQVVLGEKLRCKLEHPGGEGRCIHCTGHEGQHQYPKFSDMHRLWPYPDTKLASK